MEKRHSHSQQLHCKIPTRETQTSLGASGKRHGRELLVDQGTRGNTSLSENGNRLKLFCNYESDSFPKVQLKHSWKKC
jgi:hypothetical protein